MRSVDLQEEYTRSFSAPADFEWVFPIACGLRISSDAEPMRFPGRRAGIGALVCVISGAGTFSANGNEGTLCANLLLAAKDAAALHLLPTAPTTALYILCANARRLFDALEPATVLEKNDPIAKQFCAFCAQFKNGGIPTVYDASAQLFALFMLLHQSHHQQLGSSSSQVRLVRDAVEMVSTRFSTLEGVEDLARRLGVSKNHLIRVFTAEMGISPGKYLQNTRIDYAKALLLSQDYSIEAIAHMIGYSEGNYFCKVFKKATGESPGRYRQQAQRSAAERLAAAQKLEEIENTIYL